MIPHSDAPQIEAVLGMYSTDFRPLEIKLVSGGGFSGARIWRLKTSDGQYALRQWPLSGLGQPRLLGLHRLLNHIYRSGMSEIAVPVQALSGTRLVNLQGRLWQIEPWMPGTPELSGVPSQAKLRSAMITLARWHLLAATFQPEPAEMKWFASRPAAPSPGIAERLQRMDYWNPSRLDQARQLLRSFEWPEFRDLAARLLLRFQTDAGNLIRQLQAATQFRLHIQPCLRDIWRDHVLFSGDDVTGLIDPSACRTETVATDIVRLVGSFVGNDRTGWNVALDAYQSLRILSAEELQAIQVFDQTGVILSGMTWIDRLVLRNQQYENRDQILERLRTLITRLE